jgi:hypothetical protein
MSMHTLPAPDLIALLNWQLSAYEECEGCRFTSIRRMRNRDDVGTNWLDARLQADHRLGVAERFIVQQVVAETRRQFEVAAS